MALSKGQVKLFMGWLHNETEVAKRTRWTPHYHLLGITRVPETVGWAAIWVPNKNPRGNGSASKLAGAEGGCRADGVSCTLFSDFACSKISKFLIISLCRERHGGNEAFACIPSCSLPRLLLAKEGW